MQPRHAIYYAPAPGSAFARYGTALLGYDSFDGTETARLPPAGIAADTFHRLTEGPRRYGFHATLVAPFRLDGRSEDDLLRAAAAHAEHCHPAPLGPLAMSLLGNFVALVPRDPPPGVGELAAELVEGFAPFRAPLTPQDRARRLQSGLTPRQVELMDRWGYPYVFDEFRLHMTLTAALEPHEREPIRAALAQDFEQRAFGPITIDAISVMRQDHDSAPFRIIARLPLRGRRRTDR